MDMTLRQMPVTDTDSVGCGSRPARMISSSTLHLPPKPSSVEPHDLVGLYEDGVSPDCKVRWPKASASMISISAVMSISAMKPRCENSRCGRFAQLKEMQLL